MLSKMSWVSEYSETLAPVVTGGNCRGSGKNVKGGRVDVAVKPLLLCVSMIMSSFKAPDAFLPFPILSIRSL